MTEDKSSGDGCFACEKHASGSAVPGGIIYEDDLVYAGHSLPPDLTDVYLGWLIVEPKRHAPRLGDLTDEEAAALGQLVNRLARGLREVEGAEHVYSFVLGDAVPHLHIHLAPRYPGTPRAFWGTRLDEWPDAPRGGPSEMADVCTRLRAHLEA